MEREFVSWVPQTDVSACLRLLVPNLRVLLVVIRRGDVAVRSAR